MQDTVGSGLFELLDRGVHGLTSSGESTSGQYFDLLCMSNLSTHLDDFLARFLEFLGEVSELQHFSFDEGIPRLLHCSVDDSLVRLPKLENSLPKRCEG